jgi:hypothetical protein
MEHVSKSALVEVKRILATGDEHSLGLRRMEHVVPKCEAVTPERPYKEAGVCPYVAKFRNADGEQLCQTHAALWAARRSPTWVMSKEKQQ